jgi:hypothetical protein
MTAKTLGESLYGYDSNYKQSEPQRYEDMYRHTITSKTPLPQRVTLSQQPVPGTRWWAKIPGTWHLVQVYVEELTAHTVTLSSDSAFRVRVLREDVVFVEEAK